MIYFWRQFLAALLSFALIFPLGSEAKAASAYPNTVTYDYDAFGNLIHSTGSTPNNYLYSGEQFDPDLNLYYNRARYLNVSTGRFWSMDSFDGDVQSPMSIHKYLYARCDPSNTVDPTGREGIADAMATVAIYVTGTTLSTILIGGVFGYDVSVAGGKIDAVLLSLRLDENYGGYVGGSGADIVYMRDTGKVFLAATYGEFGLNPLSLFKGHRGLAASWGVGVAFGLASANGLSGWAAQAIIPGSVAHLLPGAFCNSSGSWGALCKLAKSAKNVSWRDFVFGIGLSTSGASYIMGGVHANIFSSVVSYDSQFNSLDELGSYWRGVVDKGLDVARRSYFDTLQNLSSHADSYVADVFSLN